jgi:anti-sigma factor RsiW
MIAVGDGVQREISELLPFYLNGTLDAGERQSVERALAADTALRAELEVLRRVREAVQADDLGQGPGELGLARLRRDLSREGKPSRMARIAALAAAFALGAGLSALVIGRSGPTGEDYAQAGAPVAGAELVVAFRPEATARQIAELLLSQEATIVDGPSAIGLYRIGLGAGADAAAVGAAFIAAHEIVESAAEAR